MYYKKEAEKVISSINKVKCDYKFAVVADSHLDNSITDTLNNIKIVDNKVNFDFMFHLGDFLNGNIPKKYTELLLKEQVELFKNAINGKFFPTQGNHDGYTDFKDSDMSTDELWKYATGKDPYYFEDLGDLRIVSVCSFTYEYDEEGKFKKLYKILSNQIEWLEKIALDTEKTVIFLSHNCPFSSLKEKDKTPILDAILRAKEKRGFDIAGWFIGHYHGDYTFKTHGINFFVIASETAYVPQLWGLEDDPEVYHERILGTRTEDLWDAVTLNLKDKKINFFRFGAGEDREVEY